jgi:hypothetical protein
VGADVRSHVAPEFVDAQMPPSPSAPQIFEPSAEHATAYQLSVGLDGVHVSPLFVEV